MHANHPAPTAVLPLSGRLIARQLAGGQEVLVGLLHLPPAFTPREGALYLALINEHGIGLVPDVIDADFPDEMQGAGMTGALRATCWRQTAVAGALTVRFVEAFPESNGWCIYGPSERALLPEGCYHRGHAFLEVQHGALATLTPPEGLHGITPAQMLDMLPLWPDASGVMHIVPTMEARWRPAYFAHSLLQAQYGAGEITAEQLKQAVEDDPRLRQIVYGRPDLEYCRYLAARRAAGGLQPQRPMTAQQQAEHEAVATQLTRQFVAQQRMDELESLARELQL